MSTLTTLSTLGPIATGVDGRYGPGGPGGWWVVFPILWFALVVTVIVLVSRRWRRGAWGPYPGGPGGWGPGGWGPGASRGSDSARAVLAERFARGEIDEREYRARLEVLLTTEARPG
jgi:putative membrane protein